MRELLAEIRENLNKKTIFDVRQIARALNVHSDYPQKPKIIEAILSYAEGIAEPQPPSVRGAPPKSDVYDERLVLQIEKCRSLFKSGGKSESVLTVNDSANADSVSGRASGILEKTDSGWFILTPTGEIFVAESFITRYSLTAGDKITGSFIRKGGSAPALLLIEEVNGFAPESTQSGRNFSSLTHIYPEKRLILGGDTACRMIDMFSPLALGQRVFISAAAYSGKTSLVKNIANAICDGYDISVVVLLLNARPEEITDFKRNLRGAELYYAAFDVPASYQARVAEAVFSYAKRMVELGRDAVVLADGLFGGYIADETARKYLYGALNADEGGSLTVISALPENASGYTAHIATANNVIKLSSELAARRIFPAIDAVKSFAGREETLLNGDELAAANYLRRNLSAEEIVKLFKSVSDNTEIISEYKNG